MAYPISAHRRSIRSADAGRSVQAVNVEPHRRGSESGWGRLPSGHRLLFHECLPPARDRRRSGADPTARVLFRTTSVIVRAIQGVGFPGVAPCRVSRNGTMLRWRVRGRCRYAPELGGRRFTPRLGRARASAENTCEREQKTEIQSQPVPASKSPSVLHLVSDTNRPEMFPRHSPTVERCLGACHRRGCTRAAESSTVCTVRGSLVVVVATSIRSLPPPAGNPILRVQRTLAAP